MPIWILISIVAGLASNAFHFFSRLFLKDGEDSTVFAFQFQVVRVIFFGIMTLFDFHVTWSSHTFVLLLLLGISELISIYSLAKMHEHSHLSISSIITRIRLVWVPILAFFILHEHLSLPQYIGIIVIFFGLCVVQAPHKILMDQGIKYAYIFSFITAVIAILTKLLTPLASLPFILLCMGMVPAIILPLAMKNRISRIKNGFRVKVKTKFAAFIVNIASVYLLFYAYKIGPVSPATGIYQSMMIVSVLAGIFLLNEKTDIKKKLIGSVITLVGVLFLTTI